MSCFGYYRWESQSSLEFAKDKYLTHNFYCLNVLPEFGVVNWLKQNNGLTRILIVKYSRKFWIILQENVKDIEELILNINANLKIMPPSEKGSLDTKVDAEPCYIIERNSCLTVEVGKSMKNGQKNFSTWLFIGLFSISLRNSYFSRSSWIQNRGNIERFWMTLENYYRKFL